MANIITDVISVTTAAGGGATVYSSTVTGKILSVIYTRGDFDSGVDFTITTDITGQTVWTENNVDASKTVSPRQATHTTAGVAATYDNTRAVLDYVGAAFERIKFVIVDGGDKKSGSFRLIIEGSK